MIDDSFFKAMQSALQNLASIFGLPVIKDVLYPFIYCVEQLSTLNIDLSGMNVTCKGSQAPLQLSLNFYINGYVILVIESDFFVTQATHFLEIFCGHLKNEIHEARTHARTRHRDISERAESRPAIGNYSFLTCAMCAPSTAYPCDADSR